MDVCVYVYTYTRSVYFWGWKRKVENLVSYPGAKKSKKRHLTSSGILFAYPRRVRTMLPLPFKSALTGDKRLSQFIPRANKSLSSRASWKIILQQPTSSQREIKTII
jgi:hypothetical protein